jgi:uncharacterized protein
VVLADVNVLVYAHREDAPHHAACRAWLEGVVNGDESFGLSELVLSGFMRVVTHPKVFTRPSSLAEALEFTEQLRGRPNNLVPDAYLAAMAIEAGCEWITTDRDFSRFKGLRWRHPVE